MESETSKTTSSSDEAWFLKNVYKLNEVFNDTVKKQQLAEENETQKVFEELQAEQPVQVNETIGVETEPLEEVQEMVEFEIEPIKVYCKKDENGNIAEVNSELFLSNLDGWEFLDEGFGDRFAHAQSQYFLKD